jgi:calpain
LAAAVLVYPIVGVREVSEVAGGGKYVKLLNPWDGLNGCASTTWAGAWGRTAPEWSNLPVIAKELGGPPEPGEGLFWMSFEDFVKGFNKVSRSAC